MDNFKAFGLPEALLENLDRLGISTPTPIQMNAIPIALNGEDILGSAQTGTGKTAAFGIPLITGLMTNDSGTALVITPTRELASQVMKSLRDMLGSRSKIQTCLIIGGEHIGKQLNQLKNGPRLIVGTPGRINDHLSRGTLDLSDTRFLVLDETDRMLDMGFSVQIEEIQTHLPEERQTLLFSATLPKNILKLSQNYLRNPKRIAVGNTSDPAKNVKQDVIKIDEKDKYPELISQLEDRKGTVIIFVKMKSATEKLAKKLNQAGYSADAIHGDLRHQIREKVIRNYRNEKFRILVATDVAARGLDIPHIEHVINYDLPQNPEDYIHRIGRTGRAGAEGEAVCFVSNADMQKWHAIDHLMNPDAPRPKPEGKGKSRSRRKKPFIKSRKKDTPVPSKKSEPVVAKPSHKKENRSDNRSGDKPEGKTGQKPHKPENRAAPKSGKKPFGKPGDKPTKAKRSFQKPGEAKKDGASKPRKKFGPGKGMTNKGKPAARRKSRG